MIPGIDVSEAQATRRGAMRLKKRPWLGRPSIRRWTVLSGKGDRGASGTELAQYEAARAEILLRIKIQQDVINYCIAVGGLLAPLAGLRASIGAEVVWLLLIGPLICVFLQVVYLKQHEYIQLLAAFIATRLSRSGSSRGDMLPGLTRFASWEVYLTNSLDGHLAVRVLSKCLGLAEGGVFTLVAVLYLAAFKIVANATGLLRHRLHVSVLCFVIADIAVVAILAVTGLVIQMATASFRMQVSRRKRLRNKSSR